MRTEPNIRFQFPTTASGGRLRGLFWLLAFGCLSLGLTVRAGTWSTMAVPAEGSGIAEVLSDGTILSMDGGGNCVLLTPDIHGSYTNGTWTVLPAMTYSRWNFGVDVLTNGQVLVTGGEYGGGSAPGEYWNGSTEIMGTGQTAEIYDPVSSAWTQHNPNLLLGDCPTELLPNGSVLVSPANDSGICALYNVISNGWSYGTIPASYGGWDECTWTKLTNGCIFSVDDSGYGEHYAPSVNQWILDGTSPLAGGGGENTSFLLPNGKVFYVGQVTNTAFYTPGSSPTNAGTWSNGPTLPVVGSNQLVAGGEGGGIMMPNGNVLLILYDTNGIGYTYEYNYQSNSFTPEPSNPGGGGYELDLPDGTIFVAGGNIYTPSGSQLAAGAPVIKTISENLNGSYHLTGTGLNGFTEGTAAIDDGQASCNFPLVRLTNSVSGYVYYARTYNWSTGGVQTGTNIVTTEFALPPGLPAGTYSLVAVADGIPSAPLSFTNAPSAAPTGLVGAAGNAQVTLAWNSVSGATAYNVKCLTTVGTPYYATLATVTGTSCTNVGFVNAYTYSFVVSAVSPGGESTNSAPLLLTPSGPPPVPAGVVATSDTLARIDLTWSPSYGATSYTINRALAAAGPYTNRASSVYPFYTDTGLTNGVAYYYEISATSAGGTSSNSAAVSAVPQAIAGFGFEVPSIGGGNYAYDPTGGFWAYSGESGLIANGSGFSNPNAPEGVQAAFVQSNGVVSQVLSGFTIGTNYTIKFYAAERPGNSQSWNVTMNGTVVTNYNPGSGATSYVLYTALFKATAVTETLAFVGTDLAGGDNTIFVDDVVISPTLNPVAPVVTLTTPTNNASFTGVPVISLAASVVTNGNTISSVQFYYDATNLIGQVTDVHSTYGWTNASSGSHSVFAQVTYDGGNVVDSAAALVTIISTNANFGFEIPSIGSGNYEYDPAGGSWAFSGSPGSGSGLVANGSGFNNPNAPQGVQAAVVQGYGTISQTFYGFAPGAVYTISFYAAERPVGSGENTIAESWNVTLDGAVIGSYNPAATATSYVVYTATFTNTTATTHSLAFVGTVSGANSVFLDAVTFSPAVSAPLVTTNTLPVTASDVVGSRVTFLAAFGGVTPISYHWRKIASGATNIIAGATNTTLTLTNLQLTNTASYQLQASNIFGVTVSSPSSLTVSNVPAAITNVVISLASQTGTGAGVFAPTWTVTTNNSLIAGQSPGTAQGNFSEEAPGRSLAFLTAGGSLGVSIIAGPYGTTASTNYLTGGNGTGPDGSYAGSNVVYTLTGNTNGYNLTNITVYGGWADNGRDQQAYTVYYSTVLKPTNFIQLAVVNFNPPDPANGQSVTRATLTPGSGVLATNAAAVKFNFLNPSSENGYCGYANIGIYGSGALTYPAPVLPPPAIVNGIVAVPGSGFELDLGSLVIGHTYILQSTTDLATGIWNTETNFVATQTSATLTNSATATTQQFFRIVAY